MHSNMSVKLFHEVKRVQGGAKIERVVIFDNRTQEETTLDVDVVLLNLGFKAAMGAIKNWGIELMGTRYLKVNARMETNLPGVYVAATYINPKVKIFPGHSSERRL